MARVTQSIGPNLVLSGFLNESKGTNIASASTTNIGAATGNYVNITGTTTITAFDTVQAGTRRVLNFNSSLTLTHNATSLILPGAASITTVAGDSATFVSLGGGNWICVNYSRALLANNVSGILPIANGGTGQSTLLLSTLISPSANRTTTSNVASDITDLQFTVSSSKKYFFRGALKIGCDNTGGVKLTLTIPTGATLSVGMQGQSTNNTTWLSVQVVSSGTLPGSAFCTSVSTGVILISGTVTVSSTSGTVSFQFASTTNTQTSTVYSEGSCIEMIPLN